MSPLGANEGSE